MLTVAIAALQMSVPTLTYGADREMRITWDGMAILTARLAAEPESELLKRPGEAMHLGYSHGPADAQFVPVGRTAETFVVKIKADMAFRAIVQVGDDSFACSDDPHAPLGSTFGHPNSLVDNSVYDRRHDWLITVQGSKVAYLGKNRYEIQASGPNSSIVFRHDYYRDHLGFFLWDRSKPLWKQPVAGWCSWMAYLQAVTEKNVLDASEFFAKNLRDYGYKVIQIDDGYQRVPQDLDSATLTEPFSNYWTKPNEKFPSGLPSLAHRIKAQGMIPGIWMGYYLPIGLTHKDGYVTDPDGKPHKGPWVNYAMNGLIPAARDEAYLDAIREFKRQGWNYFKIDTLRHILYDNYRMVPEYWRRRHESMEDAYRALMVETKKVVGPHTYLMACWGTLPELAGLPDGARIGEDVGPTFASMRRAARFVAQFQCLNNVIWRNDPDYMCLRVPLDQARAWASLTFLAGGHVMVSDPIEAYDADRLDILRRVGPPIYTRPSVVKPHGPDPEYLTLACEKGGEQWLVVGRFAWRDLPAAPIHLSQFGLDEKATYLAFDFWNERALAKSGNEFSFAALPQGSCQVVCVRRAEDFPQILGTNRHIGQGAFDLRHVRWSGHTLSGVMERGKGRAWSLYIHVPPGWIVGKIPTGAISENYDGTLRLTFPESPSPIAWRVEFDRA